jgi:tetratricopeptide (TPR) repeat protein
MQEQVRVIESLLGKREIRKAEILLAKALRGSGLDDYSQVELLVCRARTRLLSARPDDAIDDLLTVRSMMENAADTPSFLELLADCYLARFELSSVGFADRNDAAQAQALYRQILEQFPTYGNRGWVHYQLGRVQLTLSCIDEAVACFQEALLAPSEESALTAFCYERLGFATFYERRDPEGALGLLNKAVDTYPASAERLWLVQVHVLRSRVLREMYKFDKALQAAETALLVASTSRSETKMGLAEALFTVGELLSKLEGRERDVVGYLQQFLQVSKRPLGVDVTWSRVYEMLGDAQFKLSQYEDAASSYLMALQFNPYHPWEVSVYYRVARCYYQQRNYGKSVEAINRMLTAAKAEGQDVRDYRVYDVLGNAEFALGNYAKAAEAYQAALRIAPPNAENIEDIRTYFRFAQERNQLQ